MFLSIALVLGALVHAAVAPPNPPPDPPRPEQPVIIILD